MKCNRCSDNYNSRFVLTRDDSFRIGLFASGHVGTFSLRPYVRYFSHNNPGIFQKCQRKIHSEAQSLNSMSNRCTCSVTCSIHIAFAIHTTQILHVAQNSTTKQSMGTHSIRSICFLAAMQRKIMGMAHGELSHNKIRRPHASRTHIIRTDFGTFDDTCIHLVVVVVVVVGIVDTIAVRP